MANVENQPPRTDTRPAWLDWLIRDRRVASYILFAVSAVFWVGCVVLALLPRWLDHADRLEYFWPACWAGALGLLTLAGGLWHLFYEPDPADAEDVALMLAIAVVGLAGFFTAVGALALIIVWWDDVTSWLRGSEETGPGHVVLALVPLFAGLAIMFLSLQLARTRERASALLRRLLYGYNTVLMGLLLLAILLVVNVMASAAMTPKVVDFTSSGIYSLSSRSKSVLEGLQKPTHVYVIMSPGSTALNEVMTLLDNCQDVSRRIDVSVVPPDSTRADELARQFPDAGLARGSLLLVYGDDKDAPHSLVSSRDLFSEGDFDPSDPDAKKSVKFKGEDALITQLEFLEAGKQKAVVYFTQGNGEYELDNSDPQGPGGGMGSFRDRLEKRNFEVKPLRLTGAAPRVPDDAALVVVVRPLYPWTPAALKALENYMNPGDTKKAKGRLMVLFGLNADRSGQVAHTGLEDFVAKYNVRVKDERILRLGENPYQILVATNLRLAQEGNPVARAFATSRFIFTNTRPVEPSPNRGPGSSYDAQILFAAPDQQDIWAESNMEADATRLVDQLARDRDALARKLSSQPLPVTVVVTETKGLDPHGFMRQQPADGEAKPRLVVFGCADVVSNRALAAGRNQGDLFGAVASCMDWLRERPQSIGIEPKKREFFTLNPGTDTVRMAVLPGILMLFGVVGLGAGVWLVRRR